MRDRRYTSEEAIARFVQRLTDARSDVASRPSTARGEGDKQADEERTPLGI